MTATPIRSPMTIDHVMISELSQKVPEADGK